MLYIAIISLSIYLYYLWIFYKGISFKKQQKSFDRELVSIVVATRNEESNISNLLITLTNQTYPLDRYEIIIANDGSTDRTKNIVEDFSSRFENITVFDVKNREGANSPKKNALEQAIALSKNDILLLTDADCIVTTNWVKSMVSNFVDDVQMVAGFSRTMIKDWDKAELYKKFEFFDIIAIFSAAAGAIISGKYFSCSGQNIGYRKTAFQKVGGFKKISHMLSGDDVNLMQLFRKAKFRINFSFNPQSFVYTKPVLSWQQLINQRARWASNLKFQIELNPEFFIYLVSLPLLLISSYFLVFTNFKIGFLLLAAKGIGDYVYISKSFEIFNVEKERQSFFIYWLAIQPLYIFVVSIFGQLSLFNWHGRK
ncbi:MAG: glycosyltransferase [Candidatus Cloacimonadota bacterium]|nr:glycosyltransferase [Candidatus Cloacimonadota bacterium]